MGYDINWDAVLTPSSQALNVGDVACLVGSTYVLATTANLPAGDVSAGVALTPASSGAFQIQRGGWCPSTVTGLGAGAKSPVRVSSAGRLERIASPGASDRVMGYCDTLGNVFLGGASTPYIAPGSGGGGGTAIGRSVKAAPYNAVGDGVADDTAAITACLAVGGGLVIFPEGTYKVSSAIPILEKTALVGQNAVILQTGLTLAGGRVTGQYSVFELRPSTAGFFVPVYVSIDSIEFRGQNEPFFQTTLLDQGPHAALRVYNGANWPTDIYVRNCKFTSLFCNIVRHDTIGKRFVFTGNVSRNCGGELNPAFSASVISNNLFEQCWAVEATGESVIFSNNVMRNCNGGYSLGGDGGKQIYERDDCGGAITGATNATPIVIQCPSHRLIVGQAVSISGVLGNTAANIDGFAGSIVDADHFTLLAFGGSNTVGNGAYTSGGFVRFKGDFGCVISNNVIDTTFAANGISAGAPQVGTIIEGNTIRKVASAYHGIHLLATVQYFAAEGRQFQIRGNSLTAIGNTGILVECGDGHIIDNNDVEIGKMPLDTPSNGGTGIGIYISGGGEVHHIKLRDNRARGRSSEFLIDSVPNCVFTGNDGSISITNTHGPVSFDRYDEPLRGIIVLAGTPTFPNEIKASPLVGSKSQGLPFAFGQTVVAFPSDANMTLGAPDYINPLLIITSNLSTVQRDVIVPIRAGAWYWVDNRAKTAGGVNLAIRIIGASGNGAVVGAAKNALVLCDGVNWTLGPST